MFPSNRACDTMATANLPNPLELKRFTNMITLTPVHPIAERAMTTHRQPDPSLSELDITAALNILTSLTEATLTSDWPCFNQARATFIWHLTAAQSDEVIRRISDLSRSERPGYPTLEQLKNLISEQVLKSISKQGNTSTTAHQARYEQPSVETDDDSQSDRAERGVS